MIAWAVQPVTFKSRWSGEPVDHATVSIEEIAISQGGPMDRKTWLAAAILSVLIMAGITGVSTVPVVAQSYTITGRIIWQIPM